MKILMVAAECGALPGGKVGGMGDVLAEIPPALAAEGSEVHVLLPSYGVFQTGQEQIQTVSVDFAGAAQKLSLYRLSERQPGVVHWVLDHPAFAAPAGQIYHHDGAGAPFATDGNLYALLACAAAKCIEQRVWGDLDVLHLHDWHTAGVLLFRSNLPAMKVVFTIHNLGLQGQRPIDGHPSSFDSWFPALTCPADAIDPRYDDCYNPMRLGINGSDRVHVVSPTYAKEILAPNTSFLHGGEGLEADLAQADTEGRLIGILNGCPYSDTGNTSSKLFEVISRQLRIWIGQSQMVPSSHYLALNNLERLKRKKKRLTVLTSVTRITEQKVALLEASAADGSGPALDALLEDLDKTTIYVMLGSGDREMERFFTEAMARHDHFVFLNGFSEELAEALYQHGDLFMMPSTFEPCGISQMLAMAQGQPCLVHAVGGLADTVIDNEDGFAFAGSNEAEAVAAMLDRTREALHLHRKDPASWQKIASRARSRRFLWSESAKHYLKQLYA